jgi:RNA polymerase sigma factor (sigma-70 family)
MTATSANLLRHVQHLVANHAHDQLTDHQLLQRFTDQRDEALFSLLVRRHGPMVLGLCRRLLGHEQDAEDAFQAAFLILAKKAGSIRQADVGGFLYRVTYHLAVRARAQISKRHQRNQRGGAMSTSDPTSEATWNDVRAVVDEEIERLPDDLRCAVVLCYVEGKTHDEAARLLGWSKGTLRRRLGQGRELLRGRLVTRGLAPMAALTASLFAERSATATVSAVLTRATVRTVLARKVAPAVAALAEGGLEMLASGKTKLTAAIVLAISLLASGAALALRETPSRGADATPLASASADTPPPAKREAANSKEIQGVVLGPDGKPKTGAKLVHLHNDRKTEPLGTTAADGRFSVPVPNKAKGGFLLAQADGAGIDFLDMTTLKPGKPVELRLVNEQEIRGRVVNTEGKPVAGVSVVVKNLGVYPNNSMDSFLVTWKKRHFMSGIPGGDKSIWGGLESAFAAKTDAEGRFVLRGLGSERLVTLSLGGAGIAEREEWIVTRKGFDPKPYNQATLDNIPKGMEHFSNHYLLHGPDVAVVAEAEKPIVGIVKDADTGKGRPGVVVKLTRKDQSELQRVIVEARTDAQGHYELHGAQKAKRYMVEVAEDYDKGYLPCQVWAADTPGYQPVTADITVKKGVVITGKVIDKGTGKPMRGFAMTAVLQNNPFVKDYPTFGESAWFHMPDTDGNGTFRVVTIPGPVLLMGGTHDWESRAKYKAPKPDPKYPQYFLNKPGITAYYGPGGGMSPLQGNFCKVLEIKPNVQTVEQDIVLERASALSVHIQDADGKPLKDVWVAGSGEEDWHPPAKCADGTCSAYELEPGKPRLMVFYEPKRKLTGSITFKGDEKEAVVVKLGPAGAIKGRLVDADGKPVSGVAVQLYYPQRPAEEIHHVIHEAKQAVTDESGVFTLDEVIPELKCKLSFQRGRRKFERDPKPADADLQLKAGETRDLSALKVKLLPEAREE